MTIDHARFARDFFFELMKDSQRLRAGYLAERERWLRSLAVDGREEILFEFEMLLRGVERYFNLHNLPLEDEGPVVARDFSDELRAVRDAVNRALKLARFLLDPPSDRRLVFRKYLESRMADDRVRREMVEAELDQGTPQESLFLVRSSFVALRGVLDALQRLDFTPYQLFADVGQLALREVSLNKYFRPFRALEFRPEYDRIKNVRILELLKRVDPEARRPVSTAFLALFRLLHYLQLVPGPREAFVRRSQVVLALVRSEMASLAAFLEGDLSARLAKLGTEKSARAIKLAQDLRRETSRLVKGELAFTGTPPPGAVGRARDGFISECRGAVVEVASMFDPSLDAKRVFDDDTERREQSRRLRLDLFAMREVCQAAERAFTTGAEADRHLKALRAFVSYFRDVSYQLLRFSDYDPFDRFTAIVSETMSVPEGPVQRQRLAEDCRLFTVVVDAAFAAVGRREELSGMPFRMAEGRALVEQFVRERS